MYGIDPLPDEKHISSPPLFMYAAGGGGTMEKRGGNLGEPSNPTRLFVRCLVGRKDKFPNQVTSQSLLFPPFLHLSALSLFPHPPPPPPPSKGLSSNMCVQIVCETRYPLRHTHWGEAAIASLSPLFFAEKKILFCNVFFFSEHVSNTLRSHSMNTCMKSTGVRSM